MVGTNGGNMWYLIKAKDLKLTDRFMSYEPTSFELRIFKQRIEAMINDGVEDFYCPRYLPKNAGICYNESFPTWRNPKWWEWSLRLIEPYYTRMGTELEILACQAVLIKELVEKGWNLEHVWQLVWKESYVQGMCIDLELARIFASQQGLGKIVAKADGDGFLLLGSSSPASPIPVKPYQSLQAYGWVIKEVQN